jgi:hypothetical protein
MSVGVKRVCGNGEVDSQHGTGVEGSLHTGSKSYRPKEGIFCF